MTRSLTWDLTTIWTTSLTPTVGRGSILSVDLIVYLTMRLTAALTTGWWCQSFLVPGPLVTRTPARDRAGPARTGHRCLTAGLWVIICLTIGHEKIICLTTRLPPMVVLASGPLSGPGTWSGPDPVGPGPGPRSGRGDEVGPARGPEGRRHQVARPEPAR